MVLSLPAHPFRCGLPQAGGHTGCSSHPLPLLPVGTSRGKRSWSAWITGSSKSNATSD